MSVSVTSYIRPLADKDEQGQRPNAATVPALGLSNKAVNGCEYDQCCTETAAEVSTVTAESGLNGSAKTTTETVSFSTLAQPPFEEQLLTSTLWPESVLFRMA